MKKLLITSTDLMMIQFLVPHVRYLSENGFQVEIACSDVGGRMEEVRAAVAGYARAVHVVRLKRSPFSGENLRGYRDMKQLLEENHYDIIWTNEPVMGVVTRLAARNARKNGTKVLYMCHGFHFYKGAPVQNWLVYYPVERVMVHFTDAIVTINEEDYRRASNRFPTKVYTIPGVGVNTDRFGKADKGDPEKIRAKRVELGFPEGCYFLLSVGELTPRKNHQVVIRALAQLQDANIHYGICGKGDHRPQLEKLAAELGVAEQVHFFGYRRDIPDVCRAADCFVFPSLQEGMPFALMEAMSSGLPIVCSRIRGNVDLIEDGQGGFVCNANCPEAYAESIEQVRNMDVATMVEFNRRRIEMFDLIHAKENIRNILTELTG